MTDARMPDRWLNDRRLLRLSDAAHRLYITGLLWSVTNRTDGHLDATDLSLLPSVDVTRTQELVTAGLWDEAPTGGYVMGDFPATQTSATELGRLDRIRRQDRERQARKRAAGKAEGSAHPRDSHAGRPADSHADDSSGQHRTGKARTGQDRSTTPHARNTTSSAPDAGPPSSSSSWPEPTRNGHRHDVRAEALAARGWDE